MSRWRLRAACLALCGLAAADLVATESVYVGQTVCGRCHPAQRQTWYRSPHARAHAVLARPESWEIARLSGTDEAPLANPICLGCHTTAPRAERWRLDPTFHPRDGVQCELCHGPGSRHADTPHQVRLDSPGPQLCQVCHLPKGSHDAVLPPRAFDADHAWAEIAHPGAAVAAGPTGPGEDQGSAASGVTDCAPCHELEVADWRLSPHAGAAADLATDAARAVAAELGLSDDPRRERTCLACHRASLEPAGDTVDPARGVECVACHGPLAAGADGGHGSRPATVSEATCEPCHGRAAHGDGWAQGPGVAVEGHVRVGETSRPVPIYKTPFNLAVDGAGGRLFVACEASDSLVVIDVATGTVVREIEVGDLPHGVALAPDDSRVFVSNRGSDTVSVVDTASLEVVGTVEVGDEPHGLVTDLEGGTLYVANAGSADISVVDLEAGVEVKRLAAARGAWDVSRSADGRHVFVSNNLSHFVDFRTAPSSEVTVVETERSMVVDRVVIPESNLLQGVAPAPAGEFVLVTLNRTKNLVPMTRVQQGWVITNGLAILWRDGRVDQVLLDEVESYLADATDVVVTPDGRYAYVSGGGVDAVAVVDLEALRGVLERAGDEERATVLPNHRGAPTEFVLRRIAVGRNPRGLAVSPDGRFVYVAAALDDAVTVIDVGRQAVAATIDLGGPSEITLARAGERIFHSAEVTFGGQFSCHSCHPDGGVDGLTYDIEPDGLGLNPVDNRTLRGILDTAPFKWTGKNPTLARQCGPRLAVFFTRIEPFEPEQVRALERYICTIPRTPNRYRRAGELTPAQRRGREIFERTMTNSGAEIPVESRCSTCHPAPYFTNRSRVSVGEGSRLDTQALFDVPHLNNIYETAPYLHDGRAPTLEEIWTRFNPRDEHGVTNDMTKDQLNDLIEYLKTL